MSFEEGDKSPEWRYASYRTVRGALQRGVAAAVARLRDRPGPAQLVYECTSRDTRWDWQVDDRYTYLARLLRDLRLDPAPLVAQLRACGPYRPWPQPDPTDDDNQFNLAVGILETLARAGDTQARAALRAYVRDGIRWIDVLEALTDEWPVEWWDDLWEVAAKRISAADAAELLIKGEPWQRWRGRDVRLDAVLDAADRTRPSTDRRRIDLATASDAELVAALRAAVDTNPRSAGAVLWQIRRRGRPVPELLDLIEHLAPARPAGLLGALRLLGPLGVPAARRWAADAEHPLFHHAPDLLAAYGDGQDIPVLLAALDQLTDRWCGYDRLTEGLARILAGSPPAAHADTQVRLVRQLRWLTIASPHSYERASYLRSLLLLDPQRTTDALPIHLLDCEPEVRLLAAQHAPLTEHAQRWLAELRDDPIEEEKVRRAAADRVNR
ncbi:hypothetical protein GCM10027280_10560 [Micromonospora polyrhachis]|uniref:HEAT repeat domain-containing protein n=1 Tax=Micromonospora polyrhachis TaxID=1282883 RepID=A0A7W7SNK4_9ACTN|nr:hypothetical protein [Micromonospora polyrhachis]MBB4958087.1 hypothetical protein [Micromonospora polyrhachis]